MKLKELLSGIEYSSMSDIHKLNLDIKRLISNSYDAQKGDLFIAIRGECFDGHDFLDYVASKGVKAVMVEEATSLDSNLIQIKVSNTTGAIRILARNFYKDPSSNIKVIGITGTNGKTTVSYLLENIFKKAEVKTGLIGTINYKIDKEVQSSRLTTPDTLMLNELLSKLVSKSIPYCIMEVSSHGLDQGRVEGIKFKGSVFTNLSHEHLDYHKTIEDYLKAKLKLFKNLEKGSYAVINKDSAHYEDLICEVDDKDFITYGIEKDSDVMAKDLKMNLNGSRFYIYTPKGTSDIKTSLIGKYNIYNILAAVSVAIKEDLNLDVIKRGIETFSVVPGRMERIECGQDFGVIVDYAHTEDALKKVLQTLRQLTKKKIILVFGCGGDRDKTKRSKMGRVAAGLADFTIITSDNPRSENPKTIIKQIEEGFKDTSSKYAITFDRFKAIKKALKVADEDVIVLIAGKGHERNQIFRDRIVPFDDREVVQYILKNLR